MDVCKVCGTGLSFNEIGATKKFINRGAKEYYCLNCLSSKLKVSPELICSKIEQFKLQGCTLFI